MNHEAPSRRPIESLLLWLLAFFAALLAVAVVVMGVWAQRQAKSLQRLQSEIEGLRVEQRAADAHRLALQGTAMAVEERLSALDAGDVTQQLAELQAAVGDGSYHPDESGRIQDLEASLAEIQAEIDALKTGLADAISGEGSSAWAPLTESAQQSDNTLPQQVRLDVARQRQSHNLSCESSAASMVANYHRVSLSEEEVLAALPLNDNPHLGFRGNVDGPTGGLEDYGVYAGPILNILNRHGLQARIVQGGVLGIKAALARGNPVIAWVTYDCQQSVPETRIIDGEAVTLVPWQHAVVVTGYNNEGLWANDPWDGKEDFYTTEDLQRAMDYFGDMAIEVAPQ
jgi:uncharacterized protein YvpB